jgi:hypothetical protein
VTGGWEHDVKRMGGWSEGFVKRWKSVGSDSTASVRSRLQYSSSSVIVAPSDDGEAASRVASSAEGSPARGAAEAETIWS